MKGNAITNKYERIHRRRKIWHRIISVLSAFTVFVTTYALILPAITMEPSAGIKMNTVIPYENSHLSISFHVTGRAGFEDEDRAVKNASAEGVKLDVTELNVKSEAYRNYLSYVNGSIGAEDLQKLFAFNMEFTYEGARLNMDKCQIKCEIRAKQNTVKEGFLALNKGAGQTVKPLAHTSNENSEKVLALTAFEGVMGDISQRETAYAASQSDSVTLETPLAGKTMAIALYSTTNPVYTVQYYSHATVFNTTGDVNIAVLDNSNATLPQNGITYSVGSGLVDAHLNLIPGTNKYEMATHLELAPMYADRKYEYVKAPGVAYVDRNRQSPNFKLYQIWVLNAGKSASSVNQADWTVYGADVSFTNRAESASSTRIHITDSTVLRLVYNEVSGTYTNNVQFYDYDITDGDIHDSTGKSYLTSAQDTAIAWYAATYNEGINSFAAPADTVKLAFGNTNTGTAYGRVTWNGNLPNMFNSQSYKGCTFGMVTGKNADGTLRYANGISAPILFTDAQQVGKTVINGYNLQFARNGDTYVLTTVKTNTGAIAAGDLNHFNNPVCDTTTYTNIFTNNFWPMDYSSTWGGIGHDFKFGNYALKTSRKFFQDDSTFSTTQGTMPICDDGKDHNSYFGMNYQVKFTLSEDYVGALEYIFYGDDDMWVFLDDTLICDIGGVHSSVGQFVDLWPYINKLSAADKYGEHTLSFYYTERGASGSTCYMAFTLPSVSAEIPQLETANLQLGKQVINGSNTADFDFTVALYDEKGVALTDDYSYTAYSQAGELGTYIINATENIISLSHGEYVIINYLPKGTRYTVTEAMTPGYNTVYTVNEGNSTEGNTATGVLTGDTVILFTNSSGMMLPQTGGSGWWPYMIPLVLGFVMLFTIPITDKIIKKYKYIKGER